MAGGIGWLLWTVACAPGAEVQPNSPEPASPESKQKDGDTPKAKDGEPSKSKDTDSKSKDHPQPKKEPSKKGTSEAKPVDVPQVDAGPVPLPDPLNPEPLPQLIPGDQPVGISRPPGSTVTYYPSVPAAPPTAATNESFAEHEGPADFVVPNFYGQTTQQFTLGDGRLSLPRYQSGGHLSLGYSYDDNPFSQPKMPVAGGSSERVRESGLLTSLDGFFRVQIGTPRRLFLVSMDGGLNYHWGRDSSPLDYHLGLGATVVRKLGAAAQVTFNLRATYLSEPDYSQANVVPGASGGSGQNGYFTGDAKLDFNYKWTPALGTGLSLATTQIRYEGVRAQQNHRDFTIGTTANYKLERFTVVGEGRYQWVEVENRAVGKSTTVYLLAGTDWAYHSSLEASVRLGAALRHQETGEASVSSTDQGGDTVSPYGEFSFSYKPDSKNTIALQTRYGYEDAGFGGEQEKTFRVGLVYTRALTSRMSATLSGNYVRTNGSDSSGNTGLTTSGQGGDGTRLLDGSLSLDYKFTRHFSINARAAVTRSSSSEALLDFDRNLFLLSARYEF